MKTALSKVQANVGSFLVEILKSNNQWSLQMQKAQKIIYPFKYSFSILSTHIVNYINNIVSLAIEFNQQHSIF